MSSSNATWQVLGQQVLMGRMEFPASVLAALQVSTSAANAAVTSYLTAKAKPSNARNEIENDLMDPNKNSLLGYNLDAWDGYIVAREKLLLTALQLNKRLVVLAGDTHNAWHSDLTLKGLTNLAPAGTKVGEEFATSSVSSPGFEAYLAPLTPPEIKFIFENVVDDLNWMDASKRGFLKMTFTANEAKGEWFFVDTISSRTYTSTLGHSRTMAS